MKDYIESKAHKFGMTIASYVKHLILKDIEGMEYPAYNASEQTEKAYKKSLEEHKAGKSNKVKNIDKFFDEL